MIADTRKTKFKNADVLTKEEAILLKDALMSFDIETYRNYFLAMFYNPITDTAYYFDTREGFDKTKLDWCLRNWQTYGFNSISFDIPVCVAYFKNDEADCKFAHEVGSEIISSEQGFAFYNVLKAYGLKYGWFDDYAKNHFDIRGASFGKYSLKYYAAVLGLRELQDLPYEPSSVLSDADKQEVKRYCAKDCYATYRLHEAVKGPLDIRQEFGMRYGLDLRSLQDAKVAEQLLVQSYVLSKKRKPEKPDLPSAFKIKYNVPSYIKFKTLPLQQLASELDGMEFNIVDGRVRLGAMEGRVINIHGYSYKMGIGGLHSQESRVTYKASDDLMLIDCDVGSYYPSLILRNGSFPPALGKQFLDAYGSFVRMRLEAKKSGNKLMADGFKIPLNATFGKLGEQYGYLYAPELLIGVTLTGQLGLLMLIESLVEAKFEVISANTDGVVSKVPAIRLEDYRSVLSQWEKVTDFVLEETHYSAIYSRDVNSYVAFYADGSGHKAKGAYSKYGLSSLQAKVPDCQIVKDAVIKYLEDGTSVDTTIRECSDVLQFTRTKNVKSGAYFKGDRIGKVARFYYSNDSDTGLVNRVGNRVPEAWNTKPMMDLTDDIPNDLSYTTYIKRARQIINNDFEKPEYYGDLFDKLT